MNNMIQKGYDTSADGPFTSQNDSGIGYIIIPKGGNFNVFQKDIQNIFPAENSATSNTDNVKKP